MSIFTTFDIVSKIFSLLTFKEAISMSGRNTVCRDAAREFPDIMLQNPSANCLGSLISMLSHRASYAFINHVSISFDGVNNDEKITEFLIKIAQFNVKELTLNCSSCSNCLLNVGNYPTLTLLNLSNISFPPTINLPNLKTLILEEVSFQDYGLLNDIIRKCSSLSQLSINGYKGARFSILDFKNSNIQEVNLVRLGLGTLSIVVGSNIKKFEYNFGPFPLLQFPQTQQLSFLNLVSTTVRDMDLVLLEDLPNLEGLGLERCSYLLNPVIKHNKIINLSIIMCEGIASLHLHTAGLQRLNLETSHPRYIAISLSKPKDTLEAKYLMKFTNYGIDTHFFRELSQTLQDAVFTEIVFEERTESIHLVDSPFDESLGAGIIAKVTITGNFGLERHEADLFLQALLNVCSPVKLVLQVPFTVKEVMMDHFRKVQTLVEYV